MAAACSVASDKVALAVATGEVGAMGGVVAMDGVVTKNGGVVVTNGGAAVTNGGAAVTKHYAGVELVGAAVTAVELKAAGAAVGDSVQAVESARGRELGHVVLVVAVVVDGVVAEGVHQHQLPSEKGLHDLMTLEAAMRPEVAAFEVENCISFSAAPSVPMCSRCHYYHWVKGRVPQPVLAEEQWPQQAPGQEVQVVVPG